MATDNEKQRRTRVDERLALLEPEGSWQPDMLAGLARFNEKLAAGNGFNRRRYLAVATAAVLFMFLVFLPQPQVLAHRCLECSIAVWQTFASSRSTWADLLPENARKPAPDFELEDANEKRVKLSNLQGKVVLVNFWATWCEGCQMEIPSFIEFAKDYANRGLVVVGVAMDDDGWKSVKPWIKQKKVNYDMVIGNERLAKQYGLEAMPLTVLVDRAGKIADAHPGIVDKAETEQKIRKLLQEASTPR
jgi:peroxiredoxin